MELHFYPGQNLLVVVNDGTVVVKCDAVGGPPSMGTDPRMVEEPTWPGEYVIDKMHPYNTPTWPMSRIRWGAPLKDMPGKNDVWHQLRNGQWASVTRDLGISRVALMELYSNLYGVRKIPDQWVFNDFGPIAIRWFKDTNSNKRLDSNERLSGQMFHTTPVDEARHKRGLPVDLTLSHGCIHLKPADRDKLLSLNAFTQGTRFVVHQYHEKF